MSQVGRAELTVFHAVGRSIRTRTRTRTKRFPLTLPGLRIPGEKLIISGILLRTNPLIGRKKKIDNTCFFNEAEEKEKKEIVGGKEAKKKKKEMAEESGS